MTQPYKLPHRGWPETSCWLLVRSWLLPLALVACSDPTHHFGSSADGAEHDAEPLDDTQATSDTQEFDTTGEINTSPDATQPSDDARDGASVGCPTAVIGVAPGLEVAPQTNIHLTGSQSSGNGAQIVEYRWEVDQPTQSHSVFRPSPTAPDPTFEANVAGIYTFSLVVFDALGNESCVAARQQVFVLPTAAAIQVSLTWDTPHDPDQNNTGNNAGADLDLHLQSPGSNNGVDFDGDGLHDGWFDLDYDTFWDNPFPRRTTSDPTGERGPTMTRDDTDGFGPEDISFAEPDNDTTYTVGVHYWDDHGFGPSFATVQIYFGSNLRFELSGIELSHRAMWPVARIHWGTNPTIELIEYCAGTHTACATDADCSGAVCGLRIIPDYNHPEYLVP